MVSPHCLIFDPDAIRLHRPDRVGFLSVADRKRSVIGMNNIMSRMNGSTGLTWVLGSLVLAAIVVQLSQSMPAQESSTSTSNLRFCYDAAQTAGGGVPHQISISERKGTGRRCGELAQFKSFDAEAPHPVVSEAPRRPSVDCLAGRRSAVMPGIHPSALSQDDCTNALNGSLSRRAERYWF